jgi:CRISPR/Cas system CSM-associated protein Csm5 (group 7 of RAMP superfamily)
MAVSEQDKEYIELLTEKLATKVVKKVLAEHIENCPVAAKVKGYKMMLVGLGGGLGLSIAGGSGWQLVKNIVETLSK